MKGLELHLKDGRVFRPNAEPPVGANLRLIAAALQRMAGVAHPQEAARGLTLGERVYLNRVAREYQAMDEADVDGSAAAH